MNKVLLYINDFLESLDIPPLSKPEPRKPNPKIKRKSKTIPLDNK